MSKIKIYRNGTYLNGLVVDDKYIPCRDGIVDIEDLKVEALYLKNVGYDVEDYTEKPFNKTTQFEYYNEFNDKVIIRLFKREKYYALVSKQFNNIEDCNKTQEVIRRINALNMIYDHIIRHLEVNVNGLIDKSDIINELLSETFKKITKLLLPDIKTDIITAYPDVDLDDIETDDDTFYITFEYDYDASELYIDYVNYTTRKHYSVINFISKLILEDNYNSKNLDYISVIFKGDIDPAYTDEISLDYYISLEEKIKEYLDMSDEELLLLIRLEE